MKLANRFKIEDSEPTIYIGHRTRRRTNGSAKPGRIYYAEYSLHGRKYHESLNTTNKSSAMRAVWDIVRRIAEGNPERAVKRRIAWDELVTPYLDYLRNKGRAPKTMEKYEYVLGDLKEWAERTRRLSPTNFRPSDFWAFNGNMVERELAETTRYDRLIIVKQAFKWAQRRQKLIAINYIEGEELEEPEPPPQPCFTREQVTALIAAADDHLRPILATLAYAGLRFGELRDLLWSDIRLNEGAFGAIYLRRGGSRKDKTKGKRSRRIPVHPELRKELDPLPRAHALVFTRRATRPEQVGLPVREKPLLDAVKRLCKTCKFDNPKQYKLHTFRHAFASMLARNNVSYKYALEFMGHKDSAILDLYYTMFDDEAERAIAMIDYATGATATAGTATDTAAA